LSEEKKLPSGWVNAKIEDVFYFRGGGTPSKNDSSYWNGNICWASVKDVKGDFLFDTLDKITQNGVDNSATSIAIPGDVILITRINPGKTIISRITTAVNQDLKIILPRFNATSEFTKYFFDSIERKCVKLSSGTTVLGITLNNLNSIEIILPPFPEQQRIVAKIEEMFSSLDKGIESLKNAQAQLKIYRQAVLKWAFEGKLTNKNVKDGELPEGWKCIELSDISQKIQIGPFGTQLHKEDYIENGIPLLNPMHIQDGKIIPDYSYSITKQKLLSLPNYILKTGDVLLGRRGEMGRCGLIKQKENGWICGTGSLFIRPDTNKISPMFLFMQLGSPVIKKYLDNNAAGTTMANLNATIVKQILLNLPSLSEQQLIVSEIESRLSVCDKLEESIGQSLLQAESLRQSILKKAFEGKLVPQDPDDEPASVLLERIRAERGVCAMEKKTGKSKGDK